MTSLTNIYFPHHHADWQGFSFFTWARPLPSTVVLPPEKAEGCEGYLQYLHAEDGEREAARDGSKSNGKKRISLNVSAGASQCRRAEVSFSIDCVIEVSSCGGGHTFLSTTLNYVYCPSETHSHPASLGLNIKHMTWLEVCILNIWSRERKKAKLSYNFT